MSEFVLGGQPQSVVVDAPNRAPVPQVAAETAEPRRWGRIITLVTMAGTMALAGCGLPHSEATPSASPSPADARPVVSASATVGQYPAQTLISTGDLGSPVDWAIQNKGLPDYEFYGGETHSDAFSTNDSAPLFSVDLADDGTLRVQDQTGGALQADMLAQHSYQALLGAVQTEAPLLTGVMQAGVVHEVRFRIFEPDKPGDDPSITPKSYPMFLPKDPTDADKGNIYDFLPARALLDQQSVATMIQHEALHAAMQQGLQEGALTNEDIAQLGQACTVLRDKALQELTQSTQDIVDRLRYMRDRVEAKYRPAFERVANAIEDGSFASLPLTPGNSEVAECAIQKPGTAVMNVLTEQGLDPAAFDKSIEGKEDLEDILGNMGDDWYDMINQSTIYQHLREKDYLPINEDNDLFGHPYDAVNASDETTVTFADIALNFPDQVARNLKDMDPAIKQAVNKVIDFTVNHLNQKYAKEPNFTKWLNQKYGAYQAARR